MSLTHLLAEGAKDLALAVSVAIIIEQNKYDLDEFPEVIKKALSTVFTTPLTTNLMRLEGVLVSTGVIESRFSEKITALLQRAMGSSDEIKGTVESEVEGKEDDEPSTEFVPF